MPPDSEITSSRVAAANRLRTADGRIFLQETEIEAEQLVPRLMAIAENGYDQRIFVRGDRSVDYGRMMEVMGLISGAGFTKVGLVTEGDKAVARVSYNGRVWDANDKDREILV